MEVFVSLSNTECTPRPSQAIGHRFDSIAMEFDLCSVFTVHRVYWFLFRFKVINRDHTRPSVERRTYRTHRATSTKHSHTQTHLANGICSEDMKRNQQNFRNRCAVRPCERHRWIDGLRVKCAFVHTMLVVPWLSVFPFVYVTSWPIFSLFYYVRSRMRWRRRCLCLPLKSNLRNWARNHKNVPSECHAGTRALNAIDETSGKYGRRKFFALATERVCAVCCARECWLPSTFCDASTKPN